ncbi:hypothetical protein CKM354_001098800 [Cercospora kikuchii]|uniref:Myb-like domain-containing protein n=1 Tax=Cercospora kikuchii TaxID=84275 RepID=A0A9P3FHV5_9PEZI|nr:uncharacterized protein CKM354_001098800 [Cercospora kikuchii]GIZ47911.1 hypothetical protein CKM354_001098800 [Cercospora kikuchii]
MGKSTVNWDSQETWQRVVAAIIATGVKIDYKQVALHFGTTYDTIENRFRKIKKEAAVLKAEVESGERGEITPARKSAASSPKKTPRNTPRKDALANVTNGRIAKTPTPSGRKNGIKLEAIEASFTDAPSDFDDGLGGFGHLVGNFDEDINSDYLT